MASVVDSPRPRSPAPQAPARRRRGRRGRWLVGAGVVVVLAPVVLLAGAGNPPCDPGSAEPAAVSAPTSAAVGSMFAAPLQMAPGRWYRVGATKYGGAYGSSGAYLPAYPDSFAELSLLDHNPYPSFTFAEANALGSLPYGTAIRVLNGSRQRVLVKRDIGYGQGPGQAIPYRIDVYSSAAPQLGITKNPVDIQLAPASGAGATLGQLPATTTTAGAPVPGCAPSSAEPLVLTPGQTAKILPDGTAAAPASAPQAVKLAIAAGNQIDTKPYPVPAVHYGPLTQIWPAYDCSGTVSYVLYRAGLHSAYPDVSGTLESWGASGPGRWITVYANSQHTWIVVAGIAFDTSPAGNPAGWVPAGSGPRWRPNPTGNLADGLSYVVRHPPGL
jgi:hypothetical protein